MGKPLVIDGFCGLGGWAEGFLAEGYDVVGFDIERHDYGNGSYPGQLVLQDWLTLDGRQFRNAVCIVASPPCTEYSYMALPWKRARQIAGALRGENDFPVNYSGSRTCADLNALFDACFRIQREASEAGGRYVPLVVENVRAAQAWVGAAQQRFGAFFLWGDVPALLPYGAPRKGAGRSFAEHWSGSGKSDPWRNTSSDSVARKAHSAQIAKIPEPLARHIARIYKP